MDAMQPGVFAHTFPVTEAHLDQQQHVNNVVYVQWMQDVAIAHSHDCGGFVAMNAVGGSWVVRSHQIEYLKPAKLGDEIIARTWVADATKVRSLRRYEFIRASDKTLLARGETDWVFVDAKSGRPMAIPESVRDCYPLVVKPAPLPKG